MQIRHIQILLILTSLKTLGHWRDKGVEIVSIVGLVYYTLVDYYKHVRDQRYHKTDRGRSGGGGGSLGSNEPPFLEIHLTY